MKQKLFRYGAILFGVLVMAPIAVMGQSVDELCEEFINVVFPEIGNRCANLGVGAACYAYGEVDVTFFQDGQPLQVLPDVLGGEGERTPSLEGDEGIVQESFDAALFELNEDNVLDSVWGVALQEVQANLPRQSGESVLLIVFGGARIENAVFPENAVVLLDEPVLVGYDRVNVFTSPSGLDYQVESEQIETLVGGGVLEADGISPDGAWVRVFFPYDREFGERLAAWVSVDELTNVAGIETLPVIGPESYTSMQEIYLENPSVPQTCEIVPPPGIMVQGPERTETDLVINDLPVRVTSTAYIEIEGDVIRVTSVDGVSITEPETPNELVLPSGFSGVFCLDIAQDLGIDSLPNNRPVAPDAPGCRQLNVPEDGSLNDLLGLQLLPPNITKYTPNVPVIVCFSGVGGPVCEVQNLDLSEIQEYCDAGLLTEEQCRILLGG